MFDACACSALQCSTDQVGGGAQEAAVGAAHDGRLAAGAGHLRARLGRATMPCVRRCLRSSRASVPPPARSLLLPCAWAAYIARRCRAPKHLRPDGCPCAAMMANGFILPWGRQRRAGRGCCGGRRPFLSVCLTRRVRQVTGRLLKASLEIQVWRVKRCEHHFRPQGFSWKRGRSGATQSLYSRESAAENLVRQNSLHQHQRSAQGMLKASKLHVAEQK